MYQLCVFLSLTCLCYGAPSTPASTNITIPTGAELDKIVDASFKNIDSDKDGFIERYEFDTFVIVADTDDDGCMTLDEYKTFSAGTPEIATRIYKRFDPTNSNCITVDKVSDQFDAMDTDENSKVTTHEFEQYYKNLLTLLFGPQKPDPVG